MWKEGASSIYYFYLYLLALTLFLLQASDAEVTQLANGDRYLLEARGLVFSQDSTYLPSPPSFNSRDTWYGVEKLIKAAHPEFFEFQMETKKERGFDGPAFHLIGKSYNDYCVRPAVSPVTGAGLKDAMYPISKPSATAKPHFLGIGKFLLDDHKTLANPSLVVGEYAVPPELLQKWTATFAIESEKRKASSSGPITKKMKAKSGIAIPVAARSQLSPPRYRKVSGKHFFYIYSILSSIFTY